MDERRRLSLLFVEVQTRQEQLITGTPCEVPVPRNVIFTPPVLFVEDLKQSWFPSHQAERNQYRVQESFLKKN